MFGWLCEHLDELRDQACQHGLDEDFEALRDAAAGGDLDDAEVRELSRTLGGPEPDLRSVSIPGVRPGPPAAVQYRCPDGRCARLGRRAPGGPHPVCHLTGVRMKLTTGP